MKPYVRRRTCSGCDLFPTGTRVGVGSVPAADLATAVFHKTGTVTYHEHIEDGAVFVWVLVDRDRREDHFRAEWLTTLPPLAPGELPIPPGMRMPTGTPRAWLEAAVAAGWQCQCVTSGAARPCGRSHLGEVDGRCQHRADDVVPHRLVLLAPVDRVHGGGLFCEPCATGYDRQARRHRAAVVTARRDAEPSLFDLLTTED